jgi:membrane protein
VWRFSVRVGLAFDRHNGFDLAAALAYYALLSLFPAVLGVSAVLGMVLAPLQEQVLLHVAQLLPASQQLVTENLRAIIEGRATAGLLSLAGLLWSGRAVFGSLCRALDAVWETPQRRPLHRQFLVDTGLMACSALLLVASVVATAVFSLLGRADPLQASLVSPVLQLASSLVTVAATVLVFAVLYCIVPNVALSWRDVWPGALLAAVVFEAAKTVFVWYLVAAANYASVYGSLASVVVLLVWAWLSGIVVLLGAEVAAQYALGRSTARA